MINIGLKFGFFWLIVATTGAIYSMETSDWANYTASISIGKIQAQFGLEGYTTELSSFGVTTITDFDYSWCSASKNDKTAMDRCNKITAAQVFSKFASAGGLLVCTLLLPLILDVFSKKTGLFIRRLSVLVSLMVTFAIVFTGGLFLDLMKDLKSELETSLVVGSGEEELGISFIVHCIAFCSVAIGTVFIALAEISDKK